MRIPTTNKSFLPDLRKTPQEQQDRVKSPMPQQPLGGMGIPGSNPLVPKSLPTQPIQPVRVPENPRTDPVKVAPVVNPMVPVPAEPIAPSTGGVQPMTPVPVAPPTPSQSPFPQTDPNDPLTGRTIQRDPAQDRFAIAQQKFDTFVQSTDPQYKAALRDANRYGAAQGKLGSGDLRTSFGNLAGQRDLQMRTAQQGFLQDALTGTIDDQFRDLGIAQQQQGFQSEQQQRAFENELRRLGFSEDMVNSAFGRALQTYTAGQAGGTGSGTGIAVGQNTANQGNDALEALMAMLRNAPSNVGTTPPIAAPATTRYPWQAPIPMGAG